MNLKNCDFIYIVQSSIKKQLNQIYNRNYIIYFLYYTKHFY